MEGGLCYFHANPDKAVELGRNGGRHRKQTYEQSTEHIAVPASAADVRRMLAETMAEVKAGKMDPKVANTIAYLATVCCGRMRRIRLPVVAGQARTRQVRYMRRTPFDEAIRFRAHLTLTLYY
jgi:hypothetical protein